MDNVASNRSHDEQRGNETRPVVVDCGTENTFQIDPLHGGSGNVDEISYCGSVEFGVKFRPRERIANPKYTGKVGGKSITTNRILAADKGRYKVGSLLTKSIYSELLKKYKRNRTSLCENVWTSWSGRNYITVGDVYDIFTDGDISSTFVDCYGEMIQIYLLEKRVKVENKQKRKHEQVTIIKILSSNILVILKDNVKDFIDRHVTAVFREVMHEVAYFVIVPFKCSVTANCNGHWSLLVCGLDGYKWDLFNPMKSHETYEIDGRWMTAEIEEHLKDNDIGSIDEAVIDTRFHVGGVPQERNESKDCGVIILATMKYLMDFHKIEKEFGPECISMLRARLIKSAFAGKIIE